MKKKCAEMTIVWAFWHDLYAKERIFVACATKMAAFQKNPQVLVVSGPNNRKFCAKT